MRDEALEAGFARRDAAAFERAYERFGSRMYSTALRLLHNDALARECVHDVLLALWRKGSSYSPQRGNLEAFLVVCVRNAALAHVRNTARRRELNEELAPATAIALDPDPLEYEHVTQAVRSLPPTQANVITLAYYRGMSHAEIANELREPLGTIKSRISAALRSLRMTLGKEVNE